jgi:SAM-dependent methyltransferase
VPHPSVNEDPGWTSSLRLGNVDPGRDVLAFDERAARYERGWRGRLHHEIADRTATLAAATVSDPKRVLDVGCGTGYLLRILAGYYPGAELLAGVDPAPAMIKAATLLAAEQRFSFLSGRAEEIPYPSDSFDLVVSTTSFDHWADQGAGLVECACAAPRRPPGPGRPVFRIPRTAAAPTPARQGAHHGTGEPPAHRCGFPVPRMAQPLFRHHQGRHRARLIQA